MTNRFTREPSSGKRALLRVTAVVAIAAAIAIGLMNPPRGRAQSPAFDVASVKRIVGPTNQRMLKATPDGLSLLGPLGYCIQWAYASGPYTGPGRIEGPSWIYPPNAELYDIVAKTGSPVPEGQLRPMLRTLLADRFKLVVHRESRVVPVLAVTVGKDGPKLKRSANVGDGEGQVKSNVQGEWIYDFEGAPIAWLIGLLNGMTRLPNEPRPVVDETGLQGAFDFTLDLQKYREFDSSGAPLLDERGHVDMETVVRRALPDLGLRLESKRAPVEVLVIDHVEKEPTAN